MSELEIRENQHLRAEEQWQATRQQYEHYLETLHLEKEELVRRHTLETGDLRKKNAFLTEHLQKLESTAMSAVPSSSGFSNNDFSDIESITMEGGSWDQFSFLNDFSLETEPKPVVTTHVPPPQAPPTSLIMPPRKTEADKPAASGILLVVRENPRSTVFGTELFADICPTSFSSAARLLLLRVRRRRIPTSPACPTTSSRLPQPCSITSSKMLA